MSPPMFPEVESSSPKPHFPELGLSFFKLCFVCRWCAIAKPLCEHTFMNSSKADDAMAATDPGDKVELDRNG